MAKNNSKKSTSQKKKEQQLHIGEIPLKYFPKTKNNKSREYREELLRMMISIRKTNQRVQYAAQISTFNIKSITQKSGFVPSPPEVFRAIEDFVYHYENLCYRSFAYREKLFQFINAVLPVGYPEKEVSVKQMMINPIIKQANLIPVVQKFEKDSTLSALVKDRHLLTHRLYYGESFDHYLRPVDSFPPDNKNESEQKKWFNAWKEEIEKRASISNKFIETVVKLDHAVAPKIVAYKESLKK